MFGAVLVGCDIVAVDFVHNYEQTLPNSPEERKSCKYISNIFPRFIWVLIFVMYTV
jgi:hypothetical protein